VEIEGLGRVGIRGISQFQLSRRIASYSDSNGKVIPMEWAKNPIHKVIDQLMANEKEPMYTDADFQEVASIDSTLLGPIIDAIDEFNGESEGNE
jgi:hypothetical protein